MHQERLEEIVRLSAGPEGFLHKHVDRICTFGIIKGNVVFVVSDVSRLLFPVLADLGRTKMCL